MKSSVLISGEAMYPGLPPLSPVKEGPNAMVRYPFSAIVCAYNPEHCSLTAPNGPLTAIAGYFPDVFSDLYKSAANSVEKFYPIQIPALILLFSAYLTSSICKITSQKYTETI